MSSVTSTTDLESTVASERDRKPLIGGCYRLIRQIGKGSFGQIFLGINVTTAQEVAVKLEMSSAKFPQLKYESKIYRSLRGVRGFPKIMHFGTYGKSHHRALVMELLGPSLEDLMNFCSRQFSLKTVLMLADQMIRRVEYLHTKNFIHRDMKPDNFLMGIGKNCNTCYLIDFGLAKIYRDPGTRHHIQHYKDKALTGTARYATMNAHDGHELSRRDDMETMGFCFVYMLKGKLPWQGLKADTKQQKLEKITEVKQSTSLEELCKGIPAEFRMYLKYCKALRFEEVPDYSYLVHLFRILMRTMAEQYDDVYDWTVLSNKIKQTLQSKNGSSSYQAVEIN